MQFAKPALTELKTESDVEQKFVFPLLISDPPSGLGHQSSNILTKANVKGLAIDKGQSRKLYFPDYVVTLGGLPILIIEAKVPGSDLLEAFREARLYAGELNSYYSSGLNPCSLIIAVDGERLLAGHADQAKPDLAIAYDDVVPTSELMDKLDTSKNPWCLRPSRDSLPLRCSGGDDGRAAGFLRSFEPI